MSGWHVPDDLRQAYARGTIVASRAFSVEAHVVACPECRGAMGGLVPGDRLERMWRGVLAEVDAPRPGPIERALLRVGVRDDAARLLAATPSLSLSWLLAVAATLAFAVMAARADRGGYLVFLAVAPLLPLAGVAAAYAPGLDPAFEVGLAAPMRSFRLLLVRAATVLGATITLSTVGAVMLPVLDWRVAAWLLPALALTTTSLALGAFISPLHAALALSASWLGLVFVVASVAADRYATFRAGPQVGFGAVVLVAAGIVWRRRDNFERSPR